MIDQAIKHILCAVRGQPKSRTTVTRAIDLALEHAASLTFCLVMEMQFLSHSAPTINPLRLVYQQLEDIGEFSMLILCDRAERRGVKKVDYLIRKGNIPEQLVEAAIESHADLMVVGSPISSLVGESVFTPKEFESFVKELEHKANLKVLQVQHE